MHPTAERLKAEYGDKVCVDELWAAGPGRKNFFSINSAFFRKSFLQPIFECVTEEEVEDSSLLRGYADAHNVVVDNIPTIKYDNKMHICRRCVKNGRSEEDARNVQTKYSFTRSLDEAGKETSVCVTCGNTWTR